YTDLVAGERYAGIPGAEKARPSICPDDVNEIVVCGDRGKVISVPVVTAILDTCPRRRGTLAYLDLISEADPAIVRYVRPHRVSAIRLRGQPHYSQFAFRRVCDVRLNDRCTWNIAGPRGALPCLAVVIGDVDLHLRIVLSRCHQCKPAWMTRIGRRCDPSAAAEAFWKNQIRLHDMPFKSLAFVVTRLEDNAWAFAGVAYSTCRST